MGYLSQRNTNTKIQKSPVQMKARAVIRKYKLQLRQLEFKRLKQIVPAMQNDNTTNDDSDEVQILSATVAYIDQLHHKLLDQIHSVGIPPQLIKENQKHNQSTHPQEMSMEQLKHLLGQVMNNRMMKKKIKQR